MIDTGDDLFKYLRLPEGIDKDTLTGNILLRGGEFEVVYSDPDFLQKSISIWSSKWYRTFDKWIKALNIEYSPLENYDRFEEWTDNRSRSEETNGSSSDTRKKTDSTNIDTTDDREGGTRYNDDTSEHVNDKTDTENEVSAYDSSSYQPHDKSETDFTSEKSSESSGNTSEEMSIKGNTKSSGTEDITGSATNKTTGTEDEDSKHIGRTHGNIGVTTSQQMLESELQIAEWNIYEHITDIFLSEYVIPIYS